MLQWPVQVSGAVDFTCGLRKEKARASVNAMHEVKQLKSVTLIISIWKMASKSQFTDAIFDATLRAKCAPAYPAEVFRRSVFK